MQNNRVKRILSKLEYRMIDITAEAQNKGKKMNRIEDHLRDIWDNVKRTDI